MEAFSSPNHGRFTRADVTRSTIAHQLFFGGHLPADMVWICGYLDQLYTVNPVRIRGYDRAGNLLAAIRLNDIVDHDYSAISHSYLSSDEAVFLHDPAHGYVIDAFDTNGNPIQIFGEGVNDIPIRDMVITQDGTIYCAMQPGGRSSQGVYAYTPKQGYSLSYVLDQLKPPLFGKPYSDLRNELATRVDLYFHGYFRKYRRNGDRIPFPELHGGLILSIAVDDLGAIFVGGVPVGAEKYALRKYQSDGVLVWSAGITTSQNGFNCICKVDLDTNGNVYCIGVDSGGCFLKKYNSSGALQWTNTFSTYQDKRSLALHDGFIYTGGGEIASYKKNNESSILYFNSDQTTTSVQKWDSDGNLVSSVLLRGEIIWQTWVEIRYLTIESITISNNVLYCQSYHHGVTGYTALVMIVYKLSADLDKGEKLFLYVDRSNEWGSPIAVDQSGRIYLPIINDNNVIVIDGISYGYLNPHLVAYDVEGNRLWQDRNILGDQAGPAALTNPLFQYVGNYFSVDASMFTGYAYSTPLPTALETYQSYISRGRSICLINDCETPSLPIFNFLSKPSWQGDRYGLFPRLALSFGIKIPAWFRDYVGQLRQSVYRLYLTGTPDIELNLASIQIRRNTKQRWLSAVASLNSPGTVDAIVARASGELVIKRGVAFSTTNEQLDELMRVNLSGVRFDEGAKNGSVTLEGTATESVLIKTRTLQGIFYRGLDDGRRRVRCAVDTYLSPGDTADLGGGETMTVGELTYNITPQSAMMDVAEARP